MYHSSVVDVAKTHEIMARFRPIAPKPSLPTSSPSPSPGPAPFSLKPRPCRGARKRPRNQLVRHRPALLPPYCFPHVPAVGPVEQDLLNKLHKPRILSPQPVRPVGSTIRIRGIKPTYLAAAVAVSRLSPEAELEAELEAETLPAVVSDTRNRVRLVNSAYKEMVGQPECMWLDSVVSGGGSGFGMKAPRINGEVVLDIPEECPAGVGGFECRVRVEWGCEGRRGAVEGACEGVRVWCEGKDCLFKWRIRTDEGFETTRKVREENF